MISRNSIRGKYPLKRLSEIVDFLDYLRRPIKESDREPGPYPYYGANGQQGTISDFLFDEPLVLLAEDGGHFDNPERGVAYRISGKTWVNNHAHVLRPKSDVDLAYLCRVLENYDLAPFVTGTTRGKLTQGGAAEIPVPLPPLSEQRRVGVILDHADALRSKRRTAIAKLELLAQSIFIDMFGDPVSNSKGWDDGATIGDVSEVVSGITKGRKINGQKTREIPYLAVINVQDHALNLDVVKTIEATDEEIERYRLRENDLLLTEGGDPDKLGRGTLWSNELSECIHQNHVFRVRLTSTDIHPLFLNWLVGSERGKRYFLRSAKQTTGIASINMTQLRGFRILIPPLVLQHQFAREITALNELTRIAQHSELQFDRLFASLQHRAFSGELNLVAVRAELEAAG